MYALKPVFDLDAKVEVPTCMYSLPVIQSSQPITGAGQCSNKQAAPDTPAALEALSARQDAILARLGQLKEQVSAYKESLGLPAAISTSSQNVARTADLVVRCSPSYPPLSLPVVCSLLSEAGLSVHTSCHTHSSVSAPLSPSLATLLPPTQVARAVAQVRLTLIWSEVGRDCELMVSPLTQSTIKGEANLLRYLARLFPTILAYENSPKIHQLDGLLDSAASLPWVLPKARQPLLRAMSGGLSGSAFLAGPDLTIADLALYSALKSMGMEKEIQPDLLKWFKAMDVKLGGVKKNKTKSESKAGTKQGKSPVKKAKSPTKEIKMEKSPSKKSGKENTPPPSLPVNPVAGKHLGKDELFEYFNKHEIKFSNVDHPEVFTVEAMMPYLKNVKGAICKNLFLKDKKKNYYLLSAVHDKEVNLNEVGKKIGVKDLRFGDEAVMFDLLGVSQGCVTAYALVNDTKKSVKFIVDSALLDGNFNSVNFHPMVNTATSQISTADFAKFLSLTGHSILKF